MIKGQEKEGMVMWEDVLKHTNGGYDAFRAYIGEFSLNKPFCNPLRNDRHPSSAIVCKNGIWYIKDFSNGEALTCLQFAMRLFGLNFREAVDKMAIDFGLKKGNGKENIKVKIDWKLPIVDEEPVRIIFESKKWLKGHELFWERTDVTEGWCEKYDVYAVKSFAIAGKRMYIKHGEVVFAYYAKDVDKVKLYFPERVKENRFKNNVSSEYLWNLNRIPKCNKLIVQKSVKDLLITSLLFPCVIATQQESSKIFTEGLVDKIHAVAERVYVSYGSDNQGVRESRELTDKYKWGWVNPPKDYLPEVNDFYSYTKKFSLRATEDLLKQKGIL